MDFYKIPRFECQLFSLARVLWLLRSVADQADSYWSRLRSEGMYRQQYVTIDRMHTDMVIPFRDSELRRKHGAAGVRKTIYECKTGPSWGYAEVTEVADVDDTVVGNGIPPIVCEQK